jgi:class 3 adenylate cyclase
MPHYQQAKRARGLVVGDAVLNPDTGFPILTVGAPIVRDGGFLGVVSANITFDVLSRFLAAHRVTPNTVTMILDQQGAVVARSSAAADEPVRRAARQARGRGSFLYTAGSPPAEYLAVFTPFPSDFGKPWKVLTVTPTDDFLGGLKKTNARLLAIIAVLIVVDLALIFLVSARLAQPILAVSEEMRGLRSLSFGAPRQRRSPIREVAELENAAALLHNSLKSFAAYVPMGVVRRLIASGRPVAASVESRELTLLFTDLENFTSACESLSPDELSDHLSGYFEEATSAIRTEGGTVDKFIGDAVMAFWGAPQPIKGQAERACCAALRIAARVRRLNEWTPQSRPRMNVRIGLHHGRALVGNIGSSDRLSYTAIGDAVNVAARLESINKEYGTTICISDAVYREVRDKVVVRELQVVKVRGRKGELKIYELLGMKDSRDPELMPAEKDAA